MGYFRGILHKKTKIPRWLLLCEEYTEEEQEQDQKKKKQLWIQFRDASEDAPGLG